MAQSENEIAEPIVHFCVFIPLVFWRIIKMQSNITVIWVCVKTPKKITKSHKHSSFKKDYLEENSVCVNMK